MRANKIHPSFDGDKSVGGSSSRLQVNNNVLEKNSIQNLFLSPLSTHGQKGATVSASFGSSMFLSSGFITDRGRHSKDSMNTNGGGGKDGRRMQSESVAFRMKAIYLHLSFLAWTLMTVLTVYDIILAVIYETISTSQNWLLIIMLSHVSSIYINLLAHIYAMESGDVRNIRWGILAAILNMVTFIVRIWYQLTFADFMPEYYENTNT